MKDSNLTISVLKHVRYTVLDKCELSLSDFERGSDVYNYITSVNEACNLLTSLIDVLRVSEQCTE